jgi:DNA polymerase I
LTASRLLDPEKSVPHSLGPVIERYLDLKLSKEHGASDWGAMVLTAEQLQYARDDVRYLLRLREMLLAKLEEAGLLDVFGLETPLLPVIARMELHGFQVDTPRLASMLALQEKQARDLEKEIRLWFGDLKLNPASPDQLVAAFKKAGIGLEDTEEKTLRAITDERAALILEYRGAAKLASSIEGLLEAQCEGRIYARFNPLGAVTGRFSSKSPNLQNITRGPLRSCFIPSSSERALIIADYSQIELRVAALVAGESVMVEAFKRREDLHYKIAAVNLRKPISEVTRAERGSVGKSTNFGFIYGQSAEGFMVYARTEYGLILELKEATRFRNNFFDTCPALRAWHKECHRKGKDNMAEARTIYGRLLRAQADTAWARFNLWTEYVVSGSCADLLKATMVRIAAILPSDVHLVATVHDELIYDAPFGEAEQYCGMIRLAMEEVFSEMFGKDVPIEVESKVCANWGEK